MNYERSKKYNLNQICEKLIKEIPEQKKKIEHSIKENNGKLLGHIYFGDVFNKVLIELLKNYTEMETIKKYCNFVEFMWKSGDKEVINIVDVTILERLSDDKDIWNKFGENISKEFKEYINNDLIPNNVMMKHVSKL